MFGFKKDLKKYNLTEEELSKLLGLPVTLSLSKSGFKGDLQLHFQSEEDLNRIINRLK